MLTDASPRKTNSAGFLERDRIKTLDLPQDGCLPKIANSIEEAMKAGKTADVRNACAEFREACTRFYGVPHCGVRVLAARPLRIREHGTFELFGDNTPDSMLSRVWMRTTVRIRGHVIRHVHERSVPRVLSPSRFPEVRIRRLMAHTRVLRACRRFTIMRGGNAAEEALLGATERGAMAHRLID
jgi:hypothetical protein